MTFNFCCGWEKNSTSVMPVFLNVTCNLSGACFISEYGWILERVFIAILKRNIKQNISYRPERQRGRGGFVMSLKRQVGLYGQSAFGTV